MEKGQQPTIVDFHGTTGEIEAVVCGPGHRYLAHRQSHKISVCSGQGCQTCEGSGEEPVVGFLYNAYLPAEWEMCVLDGSAALADALEPLDASQRVILAWTPTGVQATAAGDVGPTLAGAIQSAHRHVLVGLVPQEEPRPVPPAYVAPPGRSELKQGLGFLHAMAMEARYDLLDTSSMALALTEELVAAGQIDLRRLTRVQADLRAKEADRFSKQTYVRSDATPDKYALEPVTDVPCAELIPICKGRCCRLHFALSLQDVAEGVVEWELGSPYQARKRRDDAYCVHSCATSQSCTVYDHRPGICRVYDCRNDERVWKDYDARIPAAWDAIGGAPEEEQT